MFAYDGVVTGEGRRKEPVLPPPLPAASYWPAPKPLNERMPRHVPVRPQGDIPVIVRLLWATHEELLPGRAIRWADGCVMVMLKAPGAPSNAHELVSWLPADDVFRTLPRRPRPLRPMSAAPQAS